MPKYVEGKLTGTGRYGLVVSRFNSLITERLLEGCLDGLLRSGVADTGITVVRVPGSFEMPVVARRMAASGNYDCLVGLGAVIRGSTPHFDFVAGEVSKGLAQVALETGVPVINAVLTTDTIEQAVERAGTKAGNKGFDAARSGVEMVNLLKELG
ncbi:MAG: 6,7-dimethyl-8-ribityllumazine synthase [Nitrospirota bacterium]|nr:6,7-dimethyl-8-ribityllumazine synthase [Nitrospirota bacterium]